MERLWKNSFERIDHLKGITITRNSRLPIFLKSTKIRKLDSWFQLTHSTPLFKYVNGLKIQLLYSICTKDTKTIDEILFPPQKHPLYPRITFYLEFFIRTPTTMTTNKSLYADNKSQERRKGFKNTNYDKRVFSLTTIT